MSTEAQGPGAGGEQEGEEQSSQAAARAAEQLCVQLSGNGAQEGSLPHNPSQFLSHQGGLFPHVLPGDRSFKLLRVRTRNVFFCFFISFLCLCFKIKIFYHEHTFIL